MKISPTLTALSTRTGGPARDFVQTLSPGQTLQAKVIDVPSAGTARLQIGLIELLAQTKAQLSPGQSLELEVKQLSPLPELKILNPPPSRPPSDQVLQQSLPKQISVREVVRELQRLVNPEPGRPDSTARPATPDAIKATATLPTSSSPVRPQGRSNPLGPGLGAGPATPAGVQASQIPTRARIDSSPAPGSRSPGVGTRQPTAAGATPGGSTAAPPAETPPHSPASTLPTGSAATTTPSGSRSSGQPATYAPNPNSSTPGKPTATAPSSPSSTTTSPASPPRSTRAPTSGFAAGGSTAQPPRPIATPSPTNTLSTSSSAQTPPGPSAATPPQLDNLPRSLQLAIQQLLRPAPEARQLNGTQVQQQLKESGLFLEQQFATGVIPKADAKLDMLRLLQLLLATRTQTGTQPGNPGGSRQDTADPVQTTTTPRPDTPAPPTAHRPDSPLPIQPSPTTPGLSGGSVTGGITEQLLRLLIGAGRRAGIASSSTTTPATTSTQQPNATAPLDPKLKAEQLLQTLQAGKDARTGSSEAARGSDASTNPVAGAQRALTERLLQLVEGGLARVQTHQAATLAQAEDGRQIWQFELPLARAQERDEVLIRLERERAKQGTAEQSRWTATLRFGFDNLGSVEARLMLEGERLSSTFWCERADTEQRFARRMPELEQGLHKVGLEIGRLTAVQGTPPNPLDLPKPPAGLLDTHV